MKKTRAEKREARVMDGLRAKVVSDATEWGDTGTVGRAALLLDERLERIERLLEQLVAKPKVSKSMVDERPGGRSVVASGRLSPRS